MSSRDESFLSNYLPYLLRQADQTLSAPFYSVLTQYGVARSEWRVMAVLHEAGELSVAELVDKALSPQPTVTHAVRRLEKRKLVKRTLGAQDKRQRFISLTATGKKLTATLVAEAASLEAEILGEAGDLTALMNKLRKLTSSVEAHFGDQSMEAPHAG